MRLKPRADNPRDGFDHQCLGRSGHALDQRVSFGEQADQDLINDRILTDDDFLRFTAYVRGNLADVIGHAILMAGFPFCDLKMLFATRNYTEGAAPRQSAQLASPNHTSRAAAEL